jgi:pimeloyl-ACP methyl ester carboxylesterase
MAHAHVPGVQFQRLKTNGIELNVATAGPADGKLVLLLHGFPEFWYGWAKQIPALAAAGYRVLAPDQRGYNTSDKPPRICDYNLDCLAADAAGVMAACGREKAVVIGHDWGGGVAWWLAQNHPQRVERLVIINVPHPLVMRRMLRTSLRQLVRSWYMFVFQLPGLPEWFGPRGNWRDVVKAMANSSRPGTFSQEDFAVYRQAWSQPGAYRSMIHWYRAAMRCRIQVPGHPRIAAPTLLLWGAQDKFIRRQAAQPSIDLCDQGRLVLFENATHWLQHEEPAEVNRLILEHIA